MGIVHNRIQSLSVAIDKKGRILSATNGPRGDFCVVVVTPETHKHDMEIVAGGLRYGSMARIYTSMAIDNEGRLLVADPGNHRVVRCTMSYDDNRRRISIRDILEGTASLDDIPKGEIIAGGRGQGPALNQLSIPQGIALDRKENLLV